jgi:hypothetical protein
MDPIRRDVIRAMSSRLRSEDKGRDVITTKPGSLSVRYFDQVKAYAPGVYTDAEVQRFTPYFLDLPEEQVAATDQRS